MAGRGQWGQPGTGPVILSWRAGAWTMALLALMSSLNVPNAPSHRGHLGSLSGPHGNDLGQELISPLLPEPSRTFKELPP